MRALPLLLALAACGPASVSGSVDGERVGGARDAFYDELVIDLGPLGEFTFVAVFVSDIPDACQVFEEVFETIEPVCDDRCDEYIDIADTFGLGHDEYWALAMVFSADGSIDGEYDYDADLSEDEFTAAISRYDTSVLQDAGTCEDACEDGELLLPDDEDGNSGVAELERDGDELKGSFDIDLGGDDRLKGSFRATECDITDWFFF